MLHRKRLEEWEVDPRIEVACRYKYESGFRIEVEFESTSCLTVLRGPSGSGKSTVLAFLAGALCPEAGRIRVDRRNFAELSQGLWVEPERRGVGMMFQDLRLFPHLNVSANLRYGTKASKEQRRRLHEVAEALGLSALMHRKPNSLSGGQRQRVALGRALCACKQLLLLDEPVSAVEFELRESIVRYVVEFVTRSQIPSLIVTHDFEMFERYSCTAIDMVDGQVRGCRMHTPQGLTSETDSSL